ncbi:DNA polymerase III subunit beta family protein [Micromonospora polyrhachis]|uniref:DNA polymerase III subunit beta family protein n=1 Tax=Micromonospora polyrhachis TaxID=1282883 RepID=UPI001613EE28|nr:MerR family transcriptional regulator [Micromonospora polyrhachis]
MHSIGEMARASGLSVSALRFYDGADVLVPAAVDPTTGYRWYDPQQIVPARMVAGLRRVGMPLAEISQAVAAQRCDPAAVRRLLDAHLRRLEDGLADARRELSRVRDLLDHDETPIATRLTLTGAELAATIDAVRFAIGRDPELPMLNAVWCEVGPETLRLVATDRFRLAVAESAIGQVTGPPAHLLVPATLIDQLRELLIEDEPVELVLTPTVITVELPRHRLAMPTLEHDFPDYRRLLGDRLGGRFGTSGGQQVTVDAPALRAALAPEVAPTVVREHNGVRYDVAILTVNETGGLTVVDGAGLDLDQSGYVGVNGDFLLDALGASGQGQLVLELDGPINPLAIRLPADEGTFSVLMPVRLS